jgi:hypothetical protein
MARASAKTKTETTAVATRPATTSLADQTAAGKNYFEQYGEQTAQTNIVGRLLKFSKGDWLAGEDNEELDVGTKLVAVMDQVLVGWVKWVDNKPVQQLMGLLIEGFQPAKRGELGDADDSEWEVDDQGRPRDPWQFTNYVIMKAPGKKITDVANLYTFTTSSRGGIGAVGKLCSEYGKAMRERPEEWPVVALKSTAYDHPNKQFGRIKVPVLEVVGWEKKQRAE